MEMHNEWKNFWVNVNGLDIEVEVAVYNKYVSAHAHYYYWHEDSIVGYHEVSLIKKRPIISIREAVKGAIKHLFKEIEEERLVTWDSKNPKSNDLVQFAMFLPEQEDEDEKEDTSRSEERRVGNER